jgi:hypothetical protein
MIIIEDSKVVMSRIKLSDEDKKWYWVKENS